MRLPHFAESFVSGEREELDSPVPSARSQTSLTSGNQSTRSCRGRYSDTQMRFGGYSDPRPKQEEVICARLHPGVHRRFP